MNDDALNIFAQCVEANVRDAAFTTDRLIESYEAMLVTMSQAYIRLYVAADKAAEVVTTRALESALDRGSVAYGSALDHINCFEKVGTNV